MNRWMHALLLQCIPLAQKAVHLFLNFDSSGPPMQDLNRVHPLHKAKNGYCVKSRLMILHGL